MNTAVQRWMVWRSSASLLSLVQMRSVCSSMPRSTRPPPEAQLSISIAWMPSAQLVEQAIERDGLAVGGRTPSC